jgi:hypothetical protein
MSSENTEEIEEENILSIMVTTRKKAQKMENSATTNLSQKVVT